MSGLVASILAIIAVGCLTFVLGWHCCRLWTSRQCRDDWWEGYQRGRKAAENDAEFAIMGGLSL